MRDEILNLIIKEGNSDHVNLDNISKIEEFMSNHVFNSVYKNIDIELCFRFIIMEFEDPIGDYELCLKYLDEIIKKDIDEINREVAIILYGHISDTGFGELDKIEKKLDSIILKSSNNQNSALACLIKVCSYKYSENIEYQIELLEKSIRLDPTNVSSYRILAKIYRDKGMQDLANIYLCEGKKYIKRIISNEVLKNDDFTNIERFFDEYIRGVDIYIFYDDEMNDILK